MILVVMLFLLMLIATGYADSGGSRLLCVSRGKVVRVRVRGVLSGGRLGEGRFGLSRVTSSVACVGLKDVGTDKRRGFLESVEGIIFASSGVMIGSFGAILLFSGGKGFVHRVKHEKRNPNRCL